MSGKEAVLVIIDLSPQLLIGGATKLQEMLQITNQLLVHKLLYYSKMNHIGVLVINGPDDDEPDLLVPLSSGRLEAVRSVKKLYDKIMLNPDYLINLKRKNDFLDCLIKSREYFEERRMKSKTSCKIFLLTDGTFLSDDYELKASMLSEMLKELPLSINIIAFDFYNSISREKLTLEQRKTSYIVRKLVEYNSQKVRLFDSQQALELLSEFRGKATAASVKFRGEFELSPTCKIQVSCYRKVVKSSLGGFKKYSKLEPFNKHQGIGEVEVENGYVDNSDPNLEFIDQADIGKGYEYGQQLIELTPEAEQSMKPNSDRELKLLGFIESHRIPRHFSMGPADCIYGSRDNNQHLRAFNAITESLISSKKIALVRFVSRKNESPKLAALYPEKKNGEDSSKSIYMLYAVELPTSEDIKEFVFGSSQRCSKQQQNQIDDLVDKMKLDEEAGDPLTDPEEVYNPLQLIINQRLLEKGLSHTNEPFEINKVDPSIKKILTKEEQVHKRAKHLESGIETEFRLQKTKENSQTAKPFWTKLAHEEILEVENADKIEKEKDRNIDEAPDGVSKNHPISDFKAMLQYRKEDLVDKAISQMQEVIVDLVNESVDGSLIDKIVECIKVLRLGCLNEEEFDQFNNFIRGMKNKFLEFRNFQEVWERMIQEKITLISKSDSEYCDISKEEALAFLLQTTGKQKNEEDNFENLFEGIP